MRYHEIPEGQRKNTKLRVLFIGRVLLSGICLGSVHGTTAGDCRARYLGSLYLLIISTDPALVNVTSRLMTHHLVCKCRGRTPCATLYCL